MDLKALSNDRVADREHKISEYWNSIDLLKLTNEKRDKDNRYVFFEGPPTANGKPGIHHVSGRTLKDSVCRYKVMQGYYVNRKAGWDTHGLPVEIEAEKQLGLHNKQDIEKYGVKEFNEKCKESVFKYESLWRKMTEKMAYLIDLDHPYITLDNDYIESTWHILDKMFKDGLIYEGHKIMPYCPRCGTGLASHEVAQGYEMIKTESAYVKFKRKGTDNEYYLAWTTTPWTLPSNVSLTVNKEFDYIKIKHKETGEILYLAKSLLKQALEKDAENYDIIAEMKGSDLVGEEYEQLLPYLPCDKKAFYITEADYVTMEDGTGIVHTAPAFGEDDYNTSRRYDLPVLNPVDEEGKYTDTPWKGMWVMDADPLIIEELKKENKLYRKQKIEHNYPHCWRCHTPLLYYAKPSWYIEVTKFKDKIVENNKTVNWYPDYVGEKRFGNWLDNLKDWALSRSRYWGTPLPIWKCEECGHMESVGSRKELKERAIEDIDENIELHRPYVDDVHLECPHCHGKMTREKDVIDVWFDSGAMPFSQWHYPFEYTEDFDHKFPADFICEGIDQTRGWFYSLLAISTYMTGKSPYKNVLVNNLVLDKYGKKMSKSRGNTIDPFELFEEYGADAVRWYLLYVSPAWTTKKVDVDGLKDISSKFFNTLRNVYNFFYMYLQTDGIDPKTLDVPYEKRSDIDKWILAKYNKLLERIEEEMDKFELTNVVRMIQDFVVEDISNWYIRRSRRRFWATELDDDKKAVLQTTYEILLGVSKIIAPFAPYTAEEFYQRLGDLESVHIDYYPKANKDLIDEKLIFKMDLVRTLVKLGRSSRENAKIKVRIPLNEIVIDGKYKEDLKDLTDLIKEELNVKNVYYEHDLKKYMNFSLKPNFKVAGSILGAKIKDFTKYLLNVNSMDFVDKLDHADQHVELNGEDTEIKKDYVDVRIESKEGFNVEMENGVFIILDTKLTKDLLDEGYLREFISKVQQLRKQNDFDVLDKIKISVEASDDLKEIFDKFKDFILKETVADSIEYKKLDAEDTDLNDKTIKIFVERI